MANTAYLGESLIPLINRLQDIFSQVTVDLKLTLPQVAVIGSQSSGKSSVLESLVGRDFLPRGADVVTRRPLVLQLIKVKSNSQPAEWGEFLHLPGRVFTDFKLIQEEIQAETDRVTGSNKNVSDKPIRLKIFSPNVLTMTLVDLPGMTKVPVGDQPSNIEARIRELVLDHIGPRSVIILAVSPANADLANSDALQLARMVDPEGERTIGVITKLDIMDRGTSAARILSNQHIPLQLGYVGVVNRAQEDIIQAKDMAAARKAEEAFFSTRPEYRDVAANCGVGNLARRLNALLVDHIRSMLPELRHAIHVGLEEHMLELRALGEPLPQESKSGRGAYLLQLLCEYSERFAAMLEGRHQDLSTRRLSGGARIRAVFNEVYARAIAEMAPMKDVSDDAILTVIKNGAGVAGTLIVPHEPFELLVRRSVMALLPPALACKEAIYSELLAIAEQACPAEAGRFPGLQRQLAASVLEFIRSGAEPAERMISSLIECEHDFINCDHPEFIGGRGAIRAVMQERALRSAQNNGQRAKDVADHNSKESSSHSSGPVAGLLSRSRAASKDAGDAGRNAHALGLKGLPDASAFPADELLSRTRRHVLPDPDDLTSAHASGSGLGSHDNAILLGAGRDGERVPSSGSVPHHAHSNSHSWFSWFSRGSEAQGNGTDTSCHPNHDGSELLALGGSGRLDPGRERSRARALGLGSSGLAEQDEIEVEVIRKLVDSYFAIVQRNLQDSVPKAIMHFMVNNTKRGMQQHLIQQLYREDLLEALLSERDDVVAQRTACKEAIGVLQAAVQALEELPNTLQAAASKPTSGRGLLTQGLSSPLPSFLSSSSITKQDVFNAPQMPPGTSFSSLSGLDRSVSGASVSRAATAGSGALTGAPEPTSLQPPLSRPSSHPKLSTLSAGPPSPATYPPSSTLPPLHPNSGKLSLPQQQAGLQAILSMS